MEKEKEKALCDCLLSFYDDDAVILSYNYLDRLFVLLLDRGTYRSHFELVKLVSDEPCKKFGFDEDVEYYPVMVAQSARHDLDSILTAFNALTRCEYVPF